MVITVKKDLGDGAGLVPAAGEHVTYTLVDTLGSNGATHQNAASSTCDNAGANTDVNGQCTIVFTSLAPGTTTGNGFVTLVVGGVTLMRDTDPSTLTVGAGPGGSGPAVKHWFTAQCTLGYPDTSNNPRSSVDFNESEVLRTFALYGSGANQQVAMFYNDEHAMTLGVRQVNTVSGGVTTTQNFPFTAMSGNPSHAVNPDSGADINNGGVDTAAGGGRPMFPAVFVTDITNNPSDRSGDWQQGSNLGASPDEVFGTWKAAVVTKDPTKNPAVKVTPDADPTKNNWNLGAGSDTPPGGFAALTNQGYGAEVKWSASGLGLQHGHIYRLLFMVHDGDQNNSGGDVGEACVNMYIP
jgi:hypothetical protein